MAEIASHRGHGPLLQLAHSPDQHSWSAFAEVVKWGFAI